MASRAPRLNRDAPFAHGAAVRADGVRLQALSWRHADGVPQIADWDALAHKATEPNPFLESWYLLPSLRALDPEGEVILLTLESGGELVGLLPLRRESRYYGHRVPHWRNWLHSNAFLGSPLVARGFEQAFWRALLGWCDRHSGTALFLHLAQMPQQDVLHETLAQVLGESARPAATVIREERAMLASPLDPEAYLDQSLSGKKRKELRRQHRRLAEEGTLSSECTRGTERLSEWAEEFLKLEQAGWKGDAGSALACDPATARLFTEALHGAAAQGRLERLAIRLDGRPIAMLASFRCPPGAFSYKTAFDESFARFSPGVLLQRENLKVLRDPAIAWADSCAAKDHPMIDHFWRERRAIAGHNIALGGAARRLAFRLLALRETGAFPKGIV